MSETPDCIFCSIVAGATPAEIVLETDDTIFFRDIDPKAAVHVVGISKQHLASLATMTAAEQALVGKLLHDVTVVATQLDLDTSGYRVITNVGADAGQQVPHLHWHILGGESLGPLRC